MDIMIREATPADAEICGRICYDAFKTISEAHGFAPDFPAPEVPTDLLTRMIADPKFYGIVAEIDGRVVGSNFLDERNMIAGVGPITVDRAVQNRAVGRRLMDAVHDRAAAKNFAGVRLIQAGFHTRSLSLALRQERCTKSRSTQTVMTLPISLTAFSSHLLETGDRLRQSAVFRACEPLAWARRAKLSSSKPRSQSAEKFW
jgi:predicted N-acetyltransferase YhbS